MPHELTVGSLFTGIGGFDLGLERAGMRTVWFCEQDPYCQRVLAKHWPGVPCYPDVRALLGNADRPSPDTLAATGRPRATAGESGSRSDLPVPLPPVDVLCGGFPCQDLSVAGKGAGIDGERSGLWHEYARVIDVLRPRYVIVENVRNLLAGDRGRWFGRVLGDLAACGYDAEWDCIPASAVGAPHRRDRVWLVAYPQCDELRHQPGRRGRADGQGAAELEHDGANGHVADAEGQRRQSRPRLGDTVGTRELSTVESQGRASLPAEGGWGSDQWAVEPDVGRVAHGVPNRVDRLRALGNALVPQIAEWIGHRIVAYERQLIETEGV